MASRPQRIKGRVRFQGFSAARSPIKTYGVTEGD
jgi:hypothetical protein